MHIAAFNQLEGREHDLISHELLNLFAKVHS